MDRASSPISMAQVGQTTISGTLNGKSVSASSGNTNRIDYGFPFEGTSVTTDATLNQLADSPASNLSTTTCSKLTRTSTFVDYFMYLPLAGGTSRPGIWIPMETLNWGFSGTAAYAKSAWSVSRVSNPTLTYNAAPGQFPTWPDGRLQDQSFPC